MTDDEDAEYWTLRGRSSHSRIHLDRDCHRIQDSYREPRPASEWEAEEKPICKICTGEAPAQSRPTPKPLSRKLEEMDPDDFPP